MESCKCPVIAEALLPKAIRHHNRRRPMTAFVLDKFAGSPGVHPIARHTGSPKTDCVNDRSSKRIFSAAFDSIRTYFHKWHKQREARTAFQHLLALDDANLDDIGVRREDVLWASRLPLSQNAAVELELLARSRKPIAH